MKWIFQCWTRTTYLHGHWRAGCIILEDLEFIIWITLLNLSTFECVPLCHKKIWILENTKISFWFVTNFEISLMWWPGNFRGNKIFNFLKMWLVTLSDSRFISSESNGAVSPSEKWNFFLQYLLCSNFRNIILGCLTSTIWPYCELWKKGPFPYFRLNVDLQTEPRPEG